MLGFEPVSAAPVSALPAVIAVMPPVVQFHGGDDAWYEPRKDGKDNTAEYAKQKDSRSKRLKEAWEDLYEPKPKVVEAEALVEPVLAEPEILTLEPFVYPAINISDEEVQAVAQAAMDYRRAMWERRLMIIKGVLARRLPPQ